MFNFGEGIASGKHVVQTVNRSAQAGKKVDWKVKWNSRLFIQTGLLLFLVWRCNINSKLTATAAVRKFILTLRAWINHNTSRHLTYPGQSRMEVKPFEWFGINIQPVKHQAIGKHHVAFSCSAQPAQPTPGWSRVGATRDCKASCGFLQKIWMCSAVLQSIQKPPINCERKLVLFFLWNVFYLIIIHHAFIKHNIP